MNFVDCQEACLSDPECIAVDMGKFKNGKYRCRTYSGDGYDFKVGCHHKEDIEKRKCYKRRSLKARTQGKRKLKQRATRKL